MRYVRSLFLLGLITISFQSIGQLEIKPLINKNQITYSISESLSTERPEGEPLPYWDDFSISNFMPDTIQTWEGTDYALWDLSKSRGVQINASLAINPPTLNVATFDGLQSDGSFYADNNDRAITDQLVTCPIDLRKTKPIEDVTAISFFWQAGGNVEKPDPKDSLFLRLSTSDIFHADSTVTLFSVGGNEDLATNIFNYEELVIPDSFLVEKVRFKFESLGDQNGPFDAWHIDWVYINEGGRESILGSYLDRSWTGQFTSIFSPYQAVPTESLISNPALFIKNQQVELSNMDRFQPEGVAYKYSLRNVITNDTIFSEQSDDFIAIPAGGSAEVSVDLSDIEASDIPQGDSVIIETAIWNTNDIEGGDRFLADSRINLRINDTLRTQYLLQDYYAYDDGSAEYAAGTNRAQAQIAVKFWLNAQDTLSHIDILFPNIDPSAAGSNLQLKIFKELINDPDSGLLRNQGITVNTATQIDQFTRYRLNNPIILNDTFYIGYQQTINEYIGVGLDRSNELASDMIYENFEGEWFRNNKIKGALMIRPVFQNIDSLVTGIDLKSELHVYPNPTKDWLTIDGRYSSIEIYNLSGTRYMYESKKDKHNIEKLKRGIYILKIELPTGSTIRKFIKQ